MLEKRAAGCFYGSVLRKREIADFILTETANVPSHLPCHAHENSFFCHLLQGCYTENYGGHNMLYAPASLTFRSSNQTHEDWVHEEARVFVLEIPKSWEVRLQEDSLTLARATGYHGSYLRLLSTRLNREFHRTDKASPLAIEGLILEMLAEASRASIALKQIANSRWLTEARDILIDRFSENLTLSDIAGLVGVHPVYLATSFRQRFGCTVGEFVRRLRIARACSDLSKPDQSLTTIALAAGFADQSHFCKAFKLYTGLTPSEYRRQFGKLKKKT